MASGTATTLRVTSTHRIKMTCNCSGSLTTTLLWVAGAWKRSRGMRRIWTRLRRRFLGLPETSVEEAGSKLRVMPCSHYFHEQCIFSWLQLNHVCPLCRFPLPTEKK